MELSRINISEKKAAQFNQKGIHSVEDLLRFFPKSYYDFRTPTSIHKAVLDEACVMVGTLSRLRFGKGVVYCDVLEETSQMYFRVKWFNKEFMYRQLQDYIGERVVVGGVLTYAEEYTRFEMISPMVFTKDIEKGLGIYPVYAAIQGLSAEYLQNAIEMALSLADHSDKYDASVRKDFNIIDQYDLYKSIHKPKCPEDVKQAKKRLIFEELYDFAYQTEVNYIKASLISPYQIRTTARMDSFIKRLPYEMTEDQMQTLTDVLNVAKDGKRINALIQGDVGCGKTIVAVCLMMAMAENGYQSVLLAPTTVLAEQHYKEIRQYCEQTGYKVTYLPGGLKAAELKSALKEIAEGSSDFIIGTHAVLSDNVKFARLGLAITDEEHRFGVLQREYLSRDAAIHTVTMSATPIPRSLGLTMYGKDKEIYTIKTMPNGRKAVKTQIYHNNPLEFEFLKRQIKEGRQVYIVCALKEDKKNSRNNRTGEAVESVEDIKAMADRFFAKDGIQSAVLTGSTPKEQTKEILERFAENKIQVMIATTVVEVGVNVPNASVIVIRNAERFGLATLHQLRGRVGRGEFQSYCILDTTDFDNDRLKVMEETTDGFVIAQKDLEQRGSGDFIGTRQSGENKCAMLMLAYPKYYKRIERYVEAKVKSELSL